MELSIDHSDKFRFFCESKQQTDSPEDILIAIEEEEGCSIHDLDMDAFELAVDAHTIRCMDWRQP